MNKVDKLLLKYKIAPGNSGYTYIKWILDNSKLDIARTKIVPLYEEVGAALSTTGSRVERAIRHALESSELHDVVNKQALALLQIECNEASDEYDISDNIEFKTIPTKTSGSYKLIKNNLSNREIALRLTEILVNNDNTLLNKKSIVEIYNQNLEELRYEQSGNISK